MSNIWYLIAETVADAVNDRDRPEPRRRPSDLSPERFGNAMVGRRTVYDDPVDLGVRHGLYNLISRRVADRVFYATVAALALGVFAHVSGLFPWVGSATFRPGSALLPDYRHDFGLHSVPVFAGQQLLIDYDFAPGDNTRKPELLTLSGAGLPSGKRHKLNVPVGSGRIAIPIDKSGFVGIKVPKRSRNTAAVSRDQTRAEVRWGISWGNPGASYRTVTMAQLDAAE